MSEKKVKVIKKDDIERKKDFEQSVEVSHMLLLIQRYPKKAVDAVKKLIDKNLVIN